MNTRLKQTLEEKFRFKLSHNQEKDLLRLFHEINSREGTTDTDIISRLGENKKICNSRGKDVFQNIKKELIRLRFPISSEHTDLTQDSIYLSKLQDPIPRSSQNNKNFTPEKIFIDKRAKNSSLSLRFIEKFPEADILYINSCLEYTQNNHFSLTDLKKNWVFIVKENWDFIKPCPCTKNHIGCNYWIFNLGFGCPFDCSYCYLQQYSNFPGIILPSNIEDFFEGFEAFNKKLKAPIRIGTGEFCDSLALDHITGFTPLLIDYFKDKNVLFELKTKSDNISNILKLAGKKNIIISWSLNPQEIINRNEAMTISLSRRLDAAEKVREKGFSVAFHFDPVIYSKNWAEMYKETIRLLYEKLPAPFAWISIGTLRGTRKLKDASESRFPGNNIFYGELLLGKDKKLRYPRFLRKQIYSKMKEMIRKYDDKTPIYLCMEDADCWKAITAEAVSNSIVEKSLLGYK